MIFLTSKQDPKTSQASSPPPFSAFKIHLQHLSLILEHNSMLMQNFSALKILYRSSNIVFPNLCSQTRSIFFCMMLSKLRSVVVNISLSSMFSLVKLSHFPTSGENNKRFDYIPKKTTKKNNLNPFPEEPHLNEKKYWKPPTCHVSPKVSFI